MTPSPDLPVEIGVTPDCFCGADYPQIYHEAGAGGVRRKPPQGAWRRAPRLSLSPPMISTAPQRRPPATALVEERAGGRLCSSSASALVVVYQRVRPSSTAGTHSVHPVAISVNTIVCTKLPDEDVPECATKSTRRNRAGSFQSPKVRTGTDRRTAEYSATYVERPRGQALFSDISPSGINAVICPAFQRGLRPLASMKFAM